MRRLSGLCKYLGTFHIIAGAWNLRCCRCITWPQVITLHMPTQLQQKQHVKWEEDKEGEEVLKHTQNLACQVLLRSCFSAWLAFWLGLPNSYAVTAPFCHPPFPCPALPFSLCLGIIKNVFNLLLFPSFRLNFWRFLHIHFWYMCVMHVVIWCGKLLCILMSSLWGCHLPLATCCRWQARVVSNGLWLDKHMGEGTICERSAEHK